VAQLSQITLFADRGNGVQENCLRSCTTAASPTSVNAYADTVRSDYGTLGILVDGGWSGGWSDGAMSPRIGW